MRSNLLLSALLLSSPALGQVVISDSFDVTGSSSTVGGFGPDGVNFEIASRLGGQAATDETLDYLQVLTNKSADAFSIADNRLQVTAAANAGAFELSGDGVTGFDFGPYLAGKVYEIAFTLDNDSLDTANRRFSFSIGTASGQFVNAVALGIQLQADADQAGAQVFKRIDTSSNPDGGDLNAAIASGLPYGTPVDVRIVVSDVDTTVGFHSTYEVYLNGSSTPADSGMIGFPSGSRHLIFDVAPNAGPVSYDDFSVTVTGDAPEPPAIGERFIYLVGGDGTIHGFTGISIGDVPLEAGGLGNGFVEATHAAYGNYQAFACDPTTGIVYGVSEFGDVVIWPTVADWLANTNADAPAQGDPRYEAYPIANAQGSIHGASYDPATGGFYVVFEGDASIDGDIGEYATAADFTTNSNVVVSPSVYGGNIANFYYWGEDAPGSRPAPNDLPGANYFSISGGGTVEGFQDLASYIASPDNRTYGNGGFGGVAGGFALPLPEEPDLGLRIVGVTRNGSGSVVLVDLEFEPQEGASYSVQASPDLSTPFTVVPGLDNVTTSPVEVTVPAGFESHGFFRLEENP